MLLPSHSNVVVLQCTSELNCELNSFIIGSPFWFTGVEKERFVISIVWLVNHSTHKFPATGTTRVQGGPSRISSVTVWTTRRENV